MLLSLILWLVTINNHKGLALAAAARIRLLLLLLLHHHTTHHTASPNARSYKPLQSRQVYAATRASAHYSPSSTNRRLPRSSTVAASNTASVSVSQPAPRSFSFWPPSAQTQPSRLRCHCVHASAVSALAWPVYAMRCDAMLFMPSHAKPRARMTPP